MILEKKISSNYFFVSNFRVRFPLDPIKLGRMIAQNQLTVNNELKENKIK